MMWQEGFKGCKVPLEHHLWTPSQALDYIMQAKTKVSDDSSASTTLSLQAVRARHIHEPEPATPAYDPMPVIAVGTTSFFGALVVATVAAGIFVWKVKADALKQLESANLQLETGIAHVLLDVSNGLGTPNQE